MRTAQTPPDQFTRMQAVMSDNTVNVIIEAATNGSLTITRDTFTQFLQAALTVDPLTHYVRGLDSWQDYVQKRSKHFPITRNWNSANDEEVGR